jgi:hypothetical protein
MARPTQSDFFAPDAQPELFDEERETPTFSPSIDSVRAHLQRILAETKAAQSLPRNRVSLYRTIFPQMTLWLPEEEAAQLRFEFEAEMERLKAA